MVQKDEGRKRSFLERTAGFLDLPGDALAGLPRLELLGDGELRLEGYQGVLFCGREEIHVDGGKWVLRIRGRGLEIRMMRSVDILIGGFIDSLDLV